MANHAIQTSFSLKPAIGYAGMIARDPSRTSIKAGIAATRKLVSVPVTGATNSETLTLTINGTAFEVELDSDTSVAEAIAALIEEINGGDEPVLASGGPTSPLYLESTIDAPFGADFSDTSNANRRLTGDFDVAESEGNLGTPVVLVAQAQELPFGVFVCKDERSTEAQAVRLPRQATDVTGKRGEGIVLADFAKTGYPVGSATPSHVRQAMCSVLRRGYVYVTVEDAVSKGGDVYVRYAAGLGGSQLGAFRSSDPGSEAGLLPGARYETSAGAGEIAIVEFNLV